MEQADGVRAAADAGDERIRQPALGLLHLLARLVADHALEVAHHRRIGMRPRRRADAVERVGDIGHPVAQRLVHGVLQRARARLHRHDRRAKHLHAEHIGLLTFDVDRAHVDDAFKSVFRAGGRRRHAMLAGARFGDDALLAHAAGEQNLAKHIVDLVRAGVVELVALEIDFRSAAMLGHALGEIERARSAHVMRRQMRQLGVKGRVGLGLVIGLLKLEDQRHQRFRDEAAAKHAEMTRGIRAGPEGVGRNRFQRARSNAGALLGRVDRGSKPLTRRGHSRAPDEIGDQPAILHARRGFHP